jgi:threonine 3-dehydrogenase
MSDKMWALCKDKPEPGLTLKQVDKPALDTTDVLIKVHKTAICGTDLHIYNWDEWAQRTIPVPMHVGHEFVGHVVEVGSKVTHFQVGDRVSGEGHIVCRFCRNCRAGRFHLCRNTIGVGVNRPGAFAEYLAIPEFNTFKVPDDISDDVVAMFDPYGNATHTALSFDLVGEDVLILGAGPIGIMAAAICRHVGARHVVITDINPYRLELAKKYGATEAVNVSDAKNVADNAILLRDAMGRLGMAEGFDVGLEMSGNATAINSMIEVMNTGGKCGLLGVPSTKKLEIDWEAIVFKSLQLKGIYGREMFDTWHKMITMLQTGLNLNDLVTHRLSARDFEQGFEAMKSGQCGKVVLDWSCF